MKIRWTTSAKAIFMPKAELSADTCILLKAGLPAEALTKAGRGDWRNLEKIVAMQPYVTTFLHRPEPYILRIASMMGDCLTLLPRLNLIA